MKQSPSDLGLLIKKKGKYRRHWEVNDFLTEMIFNQKVKSAAGQLKTVVTSSNSEINF